MISIIIPLYNVEKYIARCLDSILAQTFQDFEIIVVNDDSPDKSIDIVISYAENDKRIKIVENKENMGLGWTRMVGYTHAEGDYIVFVDSDDFIPETALEVLYNAILGSDADIVIGNYQPVSQQNVFGKASNNKLSHGSDKRSVYKSLLTNEANHSLWGKIYKSELFKVHQYVTHKRFINAEDGFLIYQVIQNSTKVVSIPEVVYYYYYNDESATKTKLSDNAIWSIVSYWNLLDRMFKEDSELYPFVMKRNLNAKLSILSEGHLSQSIDKYLEIQSLKGDIPFATLLKTLSFTDALKLTLKRFLK